ncbi:ABC transporter ATP-binding protein [Kineococcus sp. SYSU DK001]|uniref:ABC transporter ATP-binding protein n=1 Tax=Kineococcus sp. SYSU DK001 TaxID=3383122 RepID=UPI003D7D91A8
MSQNVDILNLNLALGGNQILSDVDLHVKLGTFVTLLGPSGSGKTTTLNVIAGFLQPDSGQVLLGGRDVAKLAPGARRMGIVFQNYAIFPHMTVAENVRFPLQAQGWKGDHRKRVAEVLELVQLGGFQKRRASTMSGGQLQRVALARALAPQPELLLLDEPLSALDKQLRESMQSELKAIQREVGVTTISVTHDQSEALAMSDQVVVMNRGRVEQAGSPEQMYCQPSSEFLARFLGEVNLFAVDPSGAAGPLSGDVGGQPGDLVVIRPEAFRVEDPAAPASGAHRIQGVVRQVQFQGGSSRIELDVDRSREPVVVRTPYAGRGSLLATGQRVTVTYDGARPHVIPAANTAVRLDAPNPAASLS